MLVAFYRISLSVRLEGMSGFDITLPALCKRVLRSSGVLRGAYWWLVTDASCWIGRTLEMGPIGRPETPASDYNSTLRDTRQSEHPKFILPSLQI